VKILIGVGVMMVMLAVVVGGVVLLSQQARLAGNKPLEVRVETPLRGDLLELVSAPGDVEPRIKVSISARVVARITELPHKEGEEVTAGDDTREPSVLIRLDGSDLRAALRSAEARRAAQAAQIEVARARLAGQQATIQGVQASLAEAQRNLERQKALRKSNDVSQSVVDERQRMADELRSQLAASEQTLLDALDQLEADWLRILAAHQRAQLAARVLEAEQ